MPTTNLMYCTVGWNKLRCTVCRTPQCIDKYENPGF